MEFDRLKQEFMDCICSEADAIKRQCDYSLNGVSILMNDTVSTAKYNECAMDVLCGSAFHFEIICGLKFRISATAFFQINTVSAERLYETAAQWAMSAQQNSKQKKKKKTVVFDICCGTGTIGLCIAKLCGSNIKKVIGLELIEEAVNDARFNAQSNGFSNAVFVAGKAEATLQRMLDSEVGVTDSVVAIVDPPRCGVHKDICKVLRAQSRIERIIYVSCNSASCINDALKLCQTPSKKTVGTPFKPVCAIGVDLFPHTEHVEMLMHLERCADSEIDWTQLSHQAKESHRKYLYAEQQKDKAKLMKLVTTQGQSEMDEIGKRDFFWKTRN